MIQDLYEKYVYIHSNLSHSSIKTWSVINQPSVTAQSELDQALMQIKVKGQSEFDQILF